MTKKNFINQTGMSEIEVKKACPERSEWVKRSWLITVICISSFIGSGFGFVVSCLSGINTELITFVNQIPGFTSFITNTRDALSVYPWLKAIFYIGSIAGVLYIWKLKRKGIYIYSCSQILIGVLPFFVFPYPFVQTFAIVLSGLIFIVAYILLYLLHWNDLK